MQLLVPDGTSICLPQPNDQIDFCRHAFCIQNVSLSVRKPGNAPNRPPGCNRPLHPMSTADQDLLHDLRLGQEEAAGIIQVTRQALQRGIAKCGVGKGGQNNYLNFDRLLKLWNAFEKEGKTEQLKRLNDAILLRYPTVSKINPRLSLIDNDAGFQFNELWVFSPRPFELRDPIPKAWKEGMIQHLESTKRLVYFVPPGSVADRLERIVTLWSRCPKEVYIVTSTAILLMPHWFLAFLSSPGEDLEMISGCEAAENTVSRFFEIPRQQALDVIAVLRDAGLTDANDRFVPPSTPIQGRAGSPEFKVVYSAKTDINE
jgi:hypothetical protein